VFVCVSKDTYVPLYVFVKLLCKYVRRICIISANLQYIADTSVPPAAKSPCVSSCVYDARIKKVRMCPYIYMRETPL